MPSGLVASIRAKFPGVYDDLTDQQLETKVLAKYPRYADLTRPDVPAAADLLAREGFNPGGTSDSDSSDGNVFSRLQRATIKDLGTPPSSRFNAALKLVPYALPSGGPSGAGATGELIPEIKRMVGSVEGKNPLQWIRNYQATMPSQMAKDVEQFLSRNTPTAPAPDVPAPAQVQPDAFDRALQVARQDRMPQGPPPVLRKGGSAPSVTDAVRSALEDARQPASEPGTTPPVPTQTVAGKPSITAARYDELQAGAPTPKSTQPLPATAQKAATLADTPADPAVDDIVDRMAGGANAPSKGNGKPDLKSDLDRLRRTYGADRIASELNPNAPEPVVGNIVKKTGAPSAMPDIAQKALLDHLKDPSAIQNPGNFHRALSQLLREYKRNGSAANSDVARQVADTLRKYGYDVP